MTNSTPILTILESAHRRKCSCGHAPEKHDSFPPRACAEPDCDCPQYTKHDCHGGLPGEIKPL